MTWFVFISQQCQHVFGCLQISVAFATCGIFLSRNCRTPICVGFLMLFVWQITCTYINLLYFINYGVFYISVNQIFEIESWHLFYISEGLILRMLVRWKDGFLFFHLGVVLSGKKPIHIEICTGLRDIFMLPATAWAVFCKSGPKEVYVVILWFFFYC